MKAYFTSPLRRMGLTTISLLLVLALLAVSAPAAVLAAPLPVTCAKNYVVQSGDTLSSIAVTYKLTVAELAAANNLKEPYTLYVGQTLCIPGTATTTTTSTTTATTSGPITAEFTNNTVRLKITDLTKNHGYAVKAAKVERGTMEWLKFGRFKSDKNGKASVTLKLPKRFRDAAYIQICAKDLINDKVFCARFHRTVTALPRNRR